MSEEKSVTFVGGKAVEQHESLDSSLDPDDRSEAMKAVREAIEAAGKESAEDAKSDRAKDPFKPSGAKKAAGDKSDSGKTLRSDVPARGADGKFLPSASGGDSGKTLRSDVPEKDPPEGEPVQDEEELDPAKASVKQLFKNREKLASMKREAKDEISKAREEFNQQQQAFQRQFQQFQQEQARFKQEREAWANLKKDPARAIREAGYDPERFILDLAQEGTEEGQRAAKEREFQRQLDEMRQWKEDQAKQHQQWLYEQQQAQVRDYRANVEKQFTSLAMQEEKYPHVASFYKGREKALIAEGDLTAEEFRQLTGGREASFEDVLDFIEDQLAERAKAWYSKSVPGKKSEPVNVSPPKSKGKQLSPSDSGERVSMKQKDLGDLDQDERLEAAKMAVKVALTASRQSD